MKLLEQYIRHLIEQETNATEDMPFGNHLFGEFRKRNEPDTDMEKRIYSVISNWIHNNDEQDGKIVDVAQKLIRLLMDGKYEDVLRPENGSVYRGLKMSGEEADSFFGKDVMAELNIENPYTVIDKQISYSSRRHLLSSWTYSPLIAKNFMHPRATNMSTVGKGDTVSVMMRANIPKSGDFLFNHQEIPVMGAAVYDEEEVIAVGSVNVEGFFVFPYSRLVDEEKSRAEKN